MHKKLNISSRVHALDEELARVRKKEMEDTAALEKIIQQVEANLKKSTVHFHNHS